MMRIAVISSLVHPRHGGPSAVVASHVRALRRFAAVDVFGVAEADERSEVLAAISGARLFRPCFPRRWFRAPRLNSSLALENGYDAYHAHMLWDHPTLCALVQARRHRRPIVITPHGSVSTAWRAAAPHKRLYEAIVLRRRFDARICFHALNQAEADAIRAWGYRGQIAIVPNGLPAARFASAVGPSAAVEAWPHLRGQRLLLYLGRLWGGKGLDILPEAWLRACRSGKHADDWHLVLAGPDYQGYRRELEQRIDELGIRDRVSLLGPVCDPRKESLLAASAGFVLPSASEGLSVAMLEAMAAGLPMIFTRECNFADAAEAGAGWLCKRDPEDLGNRIIDMMRCECHELRAIGERGRRLGVARYTIEGVAEALRRLYTELA